MRHYIYDCAGVNLRVQYTYDSEQVFTFVDCHVLDCNYAPVGPDITPMLDKLIVLVTEDPPTAKPVLSVMLEEIEYADRSTRS